MNVTFRPLPRWPYEQQPTRPDLFKASYRNTLDLLEREIGYLKGSEVIIGLVTTSESIRLDGRPRADMRTGYPGVEISFEIPSGQRLVFHTDVYRGYAESWQSNLRAIALGLEALRAVSRYGITTGLGEQYAGFLRLETSQASPERGRQLVEEAGSLREALKQHHPDHGGDPKRFADVQAYRQLNGGGL